MLKRWLPLLAVVTVAVSACSGGVPDPVTRQGRDTHDLYVFIFWLAMVVFVAVDGAILFAVLRYRRKPGDDTLPPQIHGNNLLEVIWFLIPVVIIAAILVLSLRTLDRVEAKAAAPSLIVDVTGFQWQWTFKYATEGFAIKGSIDAPPEMVVPVNEPIRIKIHAADVIHSFYVPQFLFKKDLIPGLDNEFDFFVEETGTFSGQCAEFCGLLHNKMTFTLRAATRPEYEQWIRDRQEDERRRLEACGEPTAEIDIVAIGIEFDKECFTLPADAPYAINFDNQDAGIAHNVALYPTDQAVESEVLNEAEIFNGPGQRTYTGTAPAEGEYFFHCDVHPIMQGTVLSRPAP